MYICQNYFSPPSNEICYPPVSGTQTIYKCPDVQGRSRGFYSNWHRGTFMEEHIPGLIEVFYKVDRLLSECGLSWKYLLSKIINVGLEPIFQLEYIFWKILNPLSTLDVPMTHCNLSHGLCQLFKMIFK